MFRAKNWVFRTAVSILILAVFVGIDFGLGSFRDIAVQRDSARMFRSEAAPFELRARVLNRNVLHLYPVAPGKTRRFRTDDFGTVIGPHKESQPDISILFLGGSTTETNEVPEAFRFPYLVGELLTSAAKGNFDGINLGVRGNTTRDSLNLFLNHPIAQKIDYIVLMHNINDRLLLSSGRGYESPVPEKYDLAIGDVGDAAWTLLTRIVDWATYHSNVIFFVRTNVFGFHPWIGRRPGRVINERTIDFPDPAPEDNIAKFADNLRLLVAAGSIRGVSVFLMTQPLGVHSESHDRYNDAIRRVARTTGTALIDLDQLLPTPRSPLFLSDNIHYSQTGSKIIAKIISREFQNALSTVSGGSVMWSGSDIPMPISMEPPDFGKCLPRPSNQVSSSAGPPKELLGLDGRYPVLSEDERTLVFQMYRKGQSGIWAADLSTGSLRKLSDDSSSHSDRHAIPIGESDELRVVFGRNNKRYERLMQLDMATGNIETLSIPPHLSASIAAEDEEGRILFAGSRVDQQGNPTSAPDLFRFDPETEDTEQLTNTEWEEWRPVVDPVTNDIYFIANPNGQFDIFRLDSRAQQSSIVFKSQSDEWDPDISPDGKWLVFASKKSGNFDLFLKRIDGQGGVIRLTSGVLDEWDPKFLPKGDAIVFAGSSGNDSPRMYYLCPFGERPN